MKVNVITRHFISNYGSLLQAIATQQAIEDLGHSCEIIDYIRDDEHYKNSELTQLKNKPSWYNNPLKRFAYLLLRQPSSVIAGKAFEKAQKKHLNLTKRFTSIDELRKENLNADVYITGSDQVWGPVIDGSYDNAYGLSFINNVKKVSYAASFGRVDFNNEIEEYYKKLLAEYTYLTAREDSAVEIIKNFGYDVEQSLDPTLLLDKNYWSKYVQPNKNGKYILIYQIHNDSRLGEYAKKIAKGKGIKLIRISASYHQIIREGKFKYNPSVEEFLTYIKNAECLITDSFHGTAFAINFNTNFVAVMPNSKTGSRNISILNLTGLKGRLLTDFDNLELADKKIDYNKVNEILDIERKKSLSILKKIIEG